MAERTRPAGFRALYADELPAAAHAPRDTFYEEGPRAGTTPAGSLKVGWTIRDSSGKVEQGFAFLINPQGLTRAQGSRAQLSATKGGMYVDDFGPGAGRIQLRQLVSDGKYFQGGFYTHREDVQRFIKLIYEPATRGQRRGGRRVFFHDNHFEPGMEERVFFPPDALQIDRDVSSPHVWRLDLLMVSLDRQPFAEVVPERSEQRTRGGRRYTVKTGDTLARLARRLAGKGASDAKVRAVRDRIVKLNPTVKQKRKLPDGRTGKPLKIYPGEILTLPA